MHAVLGNSWETGVIDKRSSINYGVRHGLLDEAEDGRGCPDYHRRSSPRIKKIMGSLLVLYGKTRDLNLKWEGKRIWKF